MAATLRTITRAHRLLALVVGAQLLLWTASGLFFTLIPIEQVRGEHLRREETAVLRDDASPMADLTTLTQAADGPLKAARLKVVLDEVVWEVETEAGTSLHDLQTGAPRAAITQDDVRRIAESAWLGRGAISSLALVESAPAEARFKGRPMWRADFQGQDTATFWIDPRNGDIAAVRTPHWRLFDLFWGLHIMDWQNRETISSWWMKLFAFGALMLSLAGAFLLVDRARKGRLLK